VIAATEALARLGEVIAVSSAWRTAPVGGPAGQPAYRNAVALWRPAAPWRRPDAALAAMLAVERALGRERRERWGPRRIDLDLLAWDPSGVVEGPGAGRGRARAPWPQLPHPRAADRAFVLRPWAEVAPGWIHPDLDRSLTDLAAATAMAGVEPLDAAEARRWAAAFGALRGPW
jgi:2-amino-4-hydroxy-6-hydroxymethyldihydropteridine diphosphokinase